MEGTITTIQRMSVHDGAGIRSTLFLKGCGMRCRWCHNPETWSGGVQLQQTAGRCIGCGSCLEACPSSALSLTAEGIRIDRRNCTVCGDCVGACPSGALSLVGERIEAREALRRVARDLPFFRQTGGGVTVSGGEPLLQPEFVAEFFALCREAGIATAVESNLLAEWKCVERLLPLVDEWMCDFKIFDGALHREMTGVGNERIRENLGRLVGSGAKVVVRTPVVPGVNDNETEIGNICRMLLPFEEWLLGYELLRFHTLGFDKFAACGMENPLAGARELSKERFETLRSFAKSILKITK